MSKSFRQCSAWVAGAAILVAGSEALLRLAFGLGNPPLSMPDPDCEYRCVPSTSYRRFGRSIEYNEWSMRSGPLAKRKTAADEFRVLVLGDSVVNGGAPTDQNELATTLLEKHLGAAFSPRPVRVGNVSAGSWGPQNLAGYTRKYGLFDADWVVLVLSSRDLTDVMSPEPAQPSPGFSGPVRALTEALTVYAPQLWPEQLWPKQLWAEQARAGQSPAPSIALPSFTPETSPDPTAVATTERALQELWSRCESQGATSVVLLYPERPELNEPYPERALLRQQLEQVGFPVIDLIPSFQQAERDGRGLYRDYVHPSAAGQKRLAEVLTDLIRSQVGQGPPG